MRNVELTGPYFHTGSYLTLRQVVDFYMRGGDFPVTNADSRDPHILDVAEQAFGFGRTAGPDLGLIDSTLVPGAFNRLARSPATLRMRFRILCTYMTLCRTPTIR